MKQQLLLLEDIEHLGCKGEVVQAKRGYARNYLIPQKRAVVADSYTLRLQSKLQAERKIQAEQDKVAALALAQQLEQVSITIETHIDREGRLYGSVTSTDIVKHLQAQGYDFPRKAIQLPKPIKRLGMTEIVILLKEGVTAKIKVDIRPKEGEGLPAKTTEIAATTDLDSAE